MKLEFFKRFLVLVVKNQMERFLMTKLAYAILLAFASVTLFADDHEMSVPNFVPLEIQQCEFADNKDMDDFLKLIPDWNKLLMNIVSFHTQGDRYTSLQNRDELYI